MKLLVKKSTFFVVVATIMCLFAFGASAHDEGIKSFNEEYKLTVSAERIYIGVGNTAKFEATVSGVEVQPEISWKVSDDTLAEISQSGELKGKKIGYVTVTASAVVAGEELEGSYPIQIVEDESELHTYLETNNFLSLQYDYDYGYYYTNDKACWQKNFGYMRAYDYAAPYIGMEYDYIRVFFTYGNEEFMLQLWKGQYTIIYGAEIGLYSKVSDGKQSDPFTFYYAVDEKHWPTMDTAVYHQEKEGDAPEDYKLIFKRPVDKYWWCTGFKLGTLRQVEPADELRLESTITFESAEMASIVAQGLNSCGFTSAESKDSMGLDSYYYDGSDTLSFSWQNISEAENTMNQKYNVVVMFIMKIITFLLEIGLVKLVVKILVNR